MFDENLRGLIGCCLFFTWIMGWLLIPSGLYFWRTGKSVFAWPRPPYRMRGLPKPGRKDFDVEVKEGPKVRWSGIRRLIAGIILLLLFVPLFVIFWRTTPNQEARIIMILALAGFLPLLWYFGTPGEHNYEEGKGGGEEEENVSNSSEGVEE